MKSLLAVVIVVVAALAGGYYYWEIGAVLQFALRFNTILPYMPEGREIGERVNLSVAWFHGSSASISVKMVRGSSFTPSFEPS
jgi:hypothetical protein